MGHYKSNVRDQAFQLFEVLGVDGKSELDRGTMQDFLHIIDELARKQVAASFTDGDRNPPVFDPGTHSVTLPESFKNSYAAYIHSGLWRIGMAEELGGQPVPGAFTWAMHEPVLGANPALDMYAGWPLFASVIHEYGTPEQRRIAELMVEHQWTATMVLTEPDAGSDFGSGRSRAAEQEDGTWHITGTKRFITGGEHDLPQNLSEEGGPAQPVLDADGREKVQIIHLVLARPADGEKGTPGLAMYVVPKYHVDLETGELLGRNGAFVEGVEHKMGLRVSTTCEIEFGGKEHLPAVGFLLGGKPVESNGKYAGTRQMFRVIEQARMMVGTKAFSTASTAYLTALDYAVNRLQGADLPRALDRTAPRVPISYHADIRRSLLTQKAYVEGLRALTFYAADLADDPATKRWAEVLRPLVKGYGSERAYEQINAALQILGGSGFLQDYPLEQYLRDARIDSLYEGTTTMQAQDLFFRQIVRDEGKAVRGVFAEIAGFVAGSSGNEAFAHEFSLLQQARGSVQGLLADMTETTFAAFSGKAAPERMHEPAHDAGELLTSSGHLMLGYLHLRGAVVAQQKLDKGGLSPADVSFYTSKVVTARFFVRGIMHPQVTGERASTAVLANLYMCNEAFDDRRMDRAPAVPLAVGAGSPAPAQRHAASLPPAPALARPMRGQPVRTQSDSALGRSAAGQN